MMDDGAQSDLVVCWLVSSSFPSSASLATYQVLSRSSYLSLRPSIAVDFDSL